jgi:hypothetical protein
MTLNELIDHANRRLAELGLDRVADGRVADSLTLRNVRFLRQAGVVSRPDGQGPAAQWGELHLRQLVATRALQSAGLSISEVRDRIAGLDPAALKVIEAEAVNSILNDSAAIATGTCSAWRITPDFLLVSTSGIRLPPEKLALIKRILDPSRT